jgi:hypothetical protein
MILTACSAPRRRIARRWRATTTAWSRCITIRPRSRQSSAFGVAVNVTVGSVDRAHQRVDHGTGYDIAWSGRADPNGMLAAMRLAKRLA